MTGAAGSEGGAAEGAGGREETDGEREAVEAGRGEGTGGEIEEGKEGAMGEVAGRGEVEEEG